jgi:hypothetical protein
MINLLHQRRTIGVLVHDFQLGGAERVALRLERFGLPRGRIRWGW